MWFVVREGFNVLITEDKEILKFVKWSSEPKKIGLVECQGHSYFVLWISPKLTQQG